MDICVETGTLFYHCDYREVFERSQKGDLIYCDPPYVDSQTILYGAQQFSFQELLVCISNVKERGVNVVLSIDGTKKSGQKTVPLNIPDGLFEHETNITVGQSMLHRFQIEGGTVIGEMITDRLLLTHKNHVIC